MSDTTQSPDIAALAGALAKAQAEIEDARTRAWNPHFEKRYADLSDVWIACRAALTKHGLSVVQLPRSDDKIVTVRTVLMHSSGQWIAGELSAPADKWTPQGIGGAVTYLRRFGLASAVGIAPRGDDDDGEGDEPGDRGYDSRPRADYAPRDERPPSDRPSAEAPRSGARAAADRAVEAQTRGPVAQVPTHDPAHLALCNDFVRRARVADIGEGREEPADIHDLILKSDLPKPLRDQALVAVYRRASEIVDDPDVLDGWIRAALSAALDEGQKATLRDCFAAADERISKLPPIDAAA